MRPRRFRPFRLGLWLGVIGAAAWFVQRYLSREEAPIAALPPAPRPEPRPEPVVPIVQPEVVEVGDVEQPGEPEVGTVEDAPPPPEAPAKKPTPVKKAAKKKEPAAKRTQPLSAAGTTWVSPDEQGICPTTHPVKAKLRSKLFHLPGMFAYDRTKPDRCYQDEAAAVADGLQKAKR
jgi:hypothetical protein